MITTRTRAHGRRTAIATAVTVLALISAGCSAPAKDPPTMPPAPAASTGVSTGASTPAPGSGLKSIDQGALQALVDATIKEQLIPGAVFVLDTPQGDFTAASGTTERGVDRPPDARDPLPDRLEPKTMTSAVVLQLAQEGKLGLQDPVSKYVSGVPGGENITVAELLKMRSGLYNHTNSPVMATSIDDDPTKAWTPQELLDIAFAQPANFAPDAEFEYSNTNYALLGLVIEKVDGKPLATAFHDRLFEPFGMLNTELPVGTSNSIPACRSPTADSFAGCCARFRAVCGFNEHLERARVAQGRPRGGPEGRFHLGDQSGTGGSHWPARARFLTGLIKNDMSLPNWWERGPARPALGLW